MFGGVASFLSVSFVGKESFFKDSTHMAYVP